MGFKVKHGDIGSIAKLAGLAGEAEAGIRQEQMAFQAAQQLREMEHEYTLAEMETEARMASREQDIQFELAKRQMSQQNDFMVKEEIRMDEMRTDALKRQRKESEFEAVMSAIDDQIGETVSREEGERMKLNAQMKYRMGPSAPRFDIPTEMEVGRYEISQRAEERAVATQRRAEEYHAKRMQDDIEGVKGPTFSERVRAMGVLKDYPQPKWYKPFDQLSAEEKMIREQAMNILQSRTITADARPTSRDEFEETYMQLFKADAAKAQQYADKYDKLEY
jgi:hypothetical protein